MHKQAFGTITHKCFHTHSNIQCWPNKEYNWFERRKKAGC